MSAEMSALEELDLLADEVEAAKKRLAELEEEKRASRRSYKEALRPLRAYFRQVESGAKEADPIREAELRAALQEAQAAVSPQLVSNPRSSLGELEKVEIVNPEVEGQLDGARERLYAAELAYKRFRDGRFDDLVVELAVLGTEYAERYELAAKHAARAAREWRKLRNRWRPLVEVADFDWADFPRSPFEGVDLKPMMPRQLAQGKPVRGPAPPMRRKRAS